MKYCLNKGKILNTIRIAEQLNFRIIGYEPILFSSPKQYSGLYQTTNEYVKKISTKEAPSKPIPEPKNKDESSSDRLPTPILSLSKK